MTFRFAELLPVAEELAGRSEAVEAHHRTAVGRAYYAAYHSAQRTWSHRSGVLARVDGRGSRHRAFHGALVADAGWRETGRALQRLYRVRLIADYDPDHHVNAGQAAEAIRDARAVLKWLHGCRGR